MRQGHSFLTNCVLYTKHTHFQSRDFSYNHLCHDKTNRTINSSSNIQKKTLNKKKKSRNKHERKYLFSIFPSNHQIHTNEIHCCQLTRFFFLAKSKKNSGSSEKLRTVFVLIPNPSREFLEGKNVGGIFWGPRPRYQTKSRAKHNQRF